MKLADIKQIELNDSIIKYSKSKNSKIKKTCIFIMCILLSAPLTACKNETQSQSKNQTKENSKIVYSAYDLLSLPNHPTIYSSVESAQEYYNNIGDNRVEITSSELSALSISSQKYEEEKSVFIYFIEQNNNENYIEDIHISIYDEELSANTNVESATKMLVSYLPSDFFKYYDYETSYVYKYENSFEYMYICSLNDAGIEYNNNSEGVKFVSEFNFQIRHNTVLSEPVNPCEWILKTGCDTSKYKYFETEPWDIDISQYIQTDW